MRSLLVPTCHSSSFAYVSTTTTCSFLSVNSISSSTRRSLRIRVSSDEQLSSSSNNKTQDSIGTDDASVPLPPPPPPAAASDSIQKDLKKVVNKTAATFAPRASTASKNPAVPGTTLYSVFEIQGYVSMFLGGVLSFNLVFPSNEPDLWRLMGMWSIWMFTIPSLRARDCPSKEKEALNYLFLLIPLLNVTIPFFWKSFAVVWSADTVAFFLMYAWKTYTPYSSFDMLYNLCLKDGQLKAGRARTSTTPQTETAMWSRTERTKLAASTTSKPTSIPVV